VTELTALLRERRRSGTAQRPAHLELDPAEERIEPTAEFYLSAMTGLTLSWAEVVLAPVPLGFVR
jgi:hypothetical protein